MVEARTDRTGKALSYHNLSIGSWLELSTEPVFGTGEKMYSPADLLWRSQYKQALAGEIPAIRVMLQIIKANVSELQNRSDDSPHPYEKRYTMLAKSEIAADPALLILGICAVGNEEVTHIGLPEEPGYGERMKAMRPTHVAQWVIDFARSQPDCRTLSDLEAEEVASFARDDDAIILRDWYKRRPELIAELVRFRGPGATRFNPGKSANARGRPRGTKPKRHESSYPFETFFMEPVVLQVGGKARTLTRMDALMCNLVMQAAKGDKKIGALIAPILVNHHQQKWFMEMYATVGIVEYRG